MKPWKSAFLWAAYPFLLLIFVFGVLAAVNWGYESKLLSVDNSALDSVHAHLGPLMLVGAMALALIASCLLFLVRFFWPISHITWFMVPLVSITILLIFPGLFIVILGPAAITMIQQMRSVSK
jgi:hypothetical protein